MAAPLFSRRPSSQSQIHSPSPAFSRNTNGTGANMNCHESFEFSSSHPLNSSLHMSTSPFSSPLSSSPNFGASDYIPSLERDFCSNFTCCGLSIGDLHELLDHFEERHVLVVDAGGIPVYPGRKLNSSSEHTPTPYSSLVLSYPQPSDPPSTGVPPSFSTVANHFPPCPEQERDIFADFDALDTEFSSDSQSSPSSLSSSSELPQTPQALPPSSFSVQRSAHPYRPVSPPQEHRTTIGAIKSRLFNSTQRRGHHCTPSRGKREKMYRCPRPGCTKAYLNPNGLKYHTEKGTCKIEPTFNQEQ